MSNLFLFANNNNDTAEGLGNYRLYNMTIDGDSEGVDSGVNYVDYLIGDSASYINTGIVGLSGYKVECTFMTTVNTTVYPNFCTIFGSANPTGYSYDTSPFGISAGVYGSCIAIKNNGETKLSYMNLSVCYNTKYTLSLTAGENNANPSNIFVFATNNSKNGGVIAYEYAMDYLRIYDFKIYNVEGTLIQHLRPCLNTEGVPCMYDEVSKKYFLNQGTGTFRYKKILRDFQPVLDSNGIPTLMDKINKKYYYDENGNGFRFEESYKPVSYLEGVVESYIDTNIIPTSNSRVEVVMSPSSTLTYAGVFGSEKLMKFQYQTTNQWITVTKGGTSHSIGNTTAPYFTGKQTIVMDMKDTTNVVSVNGINYGTHTGTTTTETRTMLLFGGWNQWGEVSGNSMGQVKIYSFKMYESDELILDLIPVLDKNDVPCMYDKVSKQFFYNQGSGSFGYGIEEDECPPANYIEYLETDGNCIIPTRIIEGVTTDLVVEAKMKLSVDNATYYVFGTMGAYTMSRTGIIKTNDKKLQFIYLQRNSTKIDFTNTDVHTFKIDKNGGYIDGELKCDLSSGESNFNANNFADSPFYLFGNYHTTANKYDYAKSKTRIYYVTLSQNGEVLADFRPCLDDNGTPCIYDAVTGEYYYNSYTGTFSCGKSMSYTPIKYIESNGTQYIDTGVAPTDNTDIDIDCRALNFKPKYIMDGLILDGTYQYNGTDTTVKSNINSNTSATLTLGSDYVTYLTQDEIVSAMMDGWVISDVNNITIVKATDDVSTFATNENVTTCAIELTDSNRSSRINNVLKYYPNCTDLYFFQDGSVTSLSTMFTSNSTYKNQIKNVTFIEGYFTGEYSLRQTFNGCQNLEKINNIPIPSSLQATFQNCYKLNCKFDFSKSTSLVNAQSVFQNCKELTYTPVMPTRVSQINTGFYACEKLEIPPLLSDDLTDVRSAFYGCKKLKSAPVIPSNGKFTDINGMFNGCSSLTKPPTIPDGITNMDSAFYNCSSLTTLPNVPSTIENLYATFYGCKALTNISSANNWDVSKVTTFSNLFRYCTGLTSVDLSNWKTDSAKSLSNMFNDCINLTTVNIKNWNVSNVTTISSMFDTCKNLQTLDLSGWDVSKVVNMQRTFFGCIKLVDLDIHDWDTSSVVNCGGNDQGMFMNCNKLLSTKFPVFDFSNVVAGTRFVNEANAITELHFKNMNNMTPFNDGYSNGGFINSSSVVTVTGVNFSKNTVSTGYVYSTCPVIYAQNLVTLELEGTIPISMKIVANNLSVESLNGIIDKLATVTETQTLIIGSTNLAKLSESKISQATSKGWILQ